MLGEKLRSREVESINPSRRDCEKHRKYICIPSRNLSPYHNPAADDRITQLRAAIV